MTLGEAPATPARVAITRGDSVWTLPRLCCCRCSAKAVGAVPQGSVFESHMTWIYDGSCRLSFESCGIF